MRTSKVVVFDHELCEGKELSVYDLVTIGNTRVKFVYNSRCELT